MNVLNLRYLVDCIDVWEAFLGASSNVNRITQLSSQNRIERWIGYSEIKNYDKLCGLRGGLDSCILEMYVEMARHISLYCRLDDTK